MLWDEVLCVIGVMNKLSSPLRTEFINRDALIDYVKALAPWAEGAASPHLGTAKEVTRRVALIDPIAYAQSRNYTDGAVTELSPYIRHGIMSLAALRDVAIEAAGHDAEKFVQQLAWRDYWQRLYRQNPDWIWHSVEPYKTGFSEVDYADDLPDDIARGQTGVAFIDGCIARLLNEGMMHNHTRLYVAAYVVHWRRVKWQAGARWFLKHLIDGDPASNNLSWQWVASTFSKKPYYFNLDNVQKYSDAGFDTSFHNNKPLAGSYESLSAQLFPFMEVSP